MKFIHILLILLVIIVILYKTLYINFFVSNLQYDPIEKVLDKTRKELTAKYGWYPMGTLVSSPEGRLRRLGLHFQVQGPLSKEDIRRLLIEATQNFERHMMEEKELKDSLVNYPVNEHNVEIALFFIDKSIMPVLSPNIARARCSYGKLSYTNVIYVYSEELKDDFPEIVGYSEESYDEALQALGLPLRNSPPLID